MRVRTIPNNNKPISRDARGGSEADFVAGKFLQRVIRPRTIAVIVFLLSFLSATSRGYCDNRERSLGPNTSPIESITRTFTEESRLGNSLRFLPIALKDGSRLTLIAPDYWTDIATSVSNEIIKTHHQLTALFGAAPPFRTSVRIMEEQDFYELTGAPSWTNAMFFRGEIIIPLDSSQPIDMENLRRSVKHEYSHAVLSSMSGGAIPGWVDEGLAQWLEGDENPVLKSSFKKYLADDQPISLRLLQGGFTKLPNAMVPAAYAESLIAMQAIIKAYSTEKIGVYLAFLRRGQPSDKAFQLAFGIPIQTFEAKLKQTLISWGQVTSRPTSRKVHLESSRGRAQPKGTYPRLAYPGKVD